MDYTEKLNDFFKKSLNMIDNQDLEREFNKTQIKYGTDLIKKDLDIQDLYAQINTIKRKTNTLNSKISDTKNKLNSMQEVLKD